MTAAIDLNKNHLKAKVLSFGEEKLMSSMLFFNAGVHLRDFCFLFLALGLVFECGAPAFGQAAASADGRRPSVYDVDEPDRPRSDIGMPIASFLLPGLDQWIEGQQPSAALYSSAAVGGLIYAGNVEANNGMVKVVEHADGTKHDVDAKGLDQKDVAGRKYVLGTLIYQGAGGMSAYQSFRTAALTRRSQGQYEFLSADETPVDVFKAPFHYQYLTRWTTIVPLGIIGALSALQLSQEPPEDAGYERTAFRGSDAFFTGAYSYNAGTHEEAMFRGWIMPVMSEYWDSPFWSNTAQALLFSASHLNTNPRPIPQLLLGYHLGYVTQEDGWNIGEAVFIHTWWNVIAFATQFSFQSTHSDDHKAAIPPFWLPPLAIVF